MKTEKKTIPRALRLWFIIHFAIDTLFALPLFFFPVPFLSALGWETVDPIASRMVAAALFGIGIESLLCRKGTSGSFRTMLSLKIIWSTAALAGLSIALFSGAFGVILTGAALLVIFLFFNILWIYWYVKLG